MITLPYNMDNEDSRKELTDLLRRRIPEMETIHSAQKAEWDDVEARLNGEYSLSGFQDDPITRLEAAAKLTANPIEQHPLFVKVPRSRPNHESLLGNFLNTDRKLTVTPRAPQYKTIARVIQERIRFIEDSSLVRELVYFPAIDGAFSKGLHWIEVNYDSAKASPNKIKLDEVSCRDVLVDSRARGPMFKTSRIFAKRFQVEKPEVEKRYAKYPYFDPDKCQWNSNAYDQGYSNSNTDSRFFATFYLVQMSIPSSDYLFINPLTREKKELTEEQFNLISNNPNLSPFVIETPEEDRWFFALYEEGNGAFFFDYNELGGSSLVPLIDIYTESRLYPYGDVKMYMALEDLLSTLVTVFIENANRTNYGIAKVTPEAWDQYSTQIQAAMDHGGVAPGIENVFYAPQINQAISVLINLITGWINDASNIHEVSKGEMPGGYSRVAKETVQALISKDRQAHGRKDIMIDAALTTVAMRMVRAITCFDTDEDFIPIKDVQTRFEFIPINEHVQGKDQYIQMLYKLAGIDEPANLQDAAQVEQVTGPLIKSFESENHVTISPMQVGWKSKDQKYLTDQQMVDQAAEDQKVPEGEKPNIVLFISKYALERAEFETYHINVLSPDVNVSVRYGIQTDFVNDPQYKANLALLLHDKGLYDRKETLEDLGKENAQEILDRVDKENEAMMLAKQLNDNPQLMQQLKATIQQMSQPAQVAQGAPAQ